jgi:MFS family permease
MNLAVFILMLGVGMIVALLPQRIIDLAGSTSNVGYLASAFALSYLFLLIPIGRLADRYGFKLFLVLGYLLCSLTGLLYFAAGSPEVIFLGRLLQGAGEAPIWALAPALLSLLYPTARGRTIGMYNASLHLGLTVGPVLGLLVAPAHTESQAFLFFAAVCLTGAATLSVFLKESGRGEARERGRIAFTEMRILARNRRAVATFAGIVLYGAGYGIFLTVIPAFLICEKGFDRPAVAVFFSLFYVAVSLSQAVAGPLSDRKGRSAFMVSGILMAALGLAIFPAFKQPWMYLLLTTASLGFGVFCVSSMAFLNEAVPDSLKGTVSGAYYLSWGAGYFWGPLAAGRMSTSVGLEAVFLLLAVLLVLEAAALAFAELRGRTE